MYRCGLPSVICANPTILPSLANIFANIVNRLEGLQVYMGLNLSENPVIKYILELVNRLKNELTLCLNKSKHEQ